MQQETESEDLDKSHFNGSLSGNYGSFLWDNRRVEGITMERRES